MAAKNEITGDSLVSKKNNDNYRNNYDAIFGKKKEEKDDGNNRVAETVPEQEAS